MFRTVAILISICSSFSLFGQTELHFLNPSFEGEPADATMPVSWFGCQSGTTPDILPGPWGVYQEAEDGDTYLGLITRSDGSWESISQRLSGPAIKGECYRFRIHVSRGATYSGYNQPIQLRLYAGKNRCSKDQFIGTTGVVKSSDWEAVDFSFTAKQTTHYLIFEAYYPNEKLKTANGNVLLDDISPLFLCPRAQHDSANSPSAHTTY